MAATLQVSVSFGQFCSLYISFELVFKRGNGSHVQSKYIYKKNKAAKLSPETKTVTQTWIKKSGMVCNKLGIASSYW